MNRPVDNDIWLTPPSISPVYIECVRDQTISKTSTLVRYCTFINFCDPLCEGQKDRICSSSFMFDSKLPTPRIPTSAGSPLAGSNVA